jgi:hypothetical protein
MKRGYNVILSLRYTTTVKIETEKEDEEEIIEDVRQGFIQDVVDVRGARDFLELAKAVKIERNYSESTDKEFKDWVNGKPFEVHYSTRAGGLSVTVNAVDEIEAVLMTDEILETCFISEDGLTECEIDKYEYYDVWDLEEVKKADEQAMENERRKGSK